MSTPPHAIYSRYKNHGLRITRWLIKAARDNNLEVTPSQKGYDLQLSKYISLSFELVYHLGVRPPQSYKKDLNAIIKLRERCARWYRANRPTESNATHEAFICKMRRVRQIWFGVELGYNTPDSESEGIAMVLSYSISFLNPSDLHVDADDDLSDLPLSAFGLEEKEEEAEFEFALWTSLKELEGYRDLIRQQWGIRCTNGSSPSLFALLMLHHLAIQAAKSIQADLEHRFPTFERLDYADAVCVVLGSPQNGSSLVTEAQMYSFLMIEVWSILRSQASGSQPEHPNHPLILQFHRWRSWDAKEGPTYDNPQWRVPHRRITLAEVFQFDLHNDALWRDQEAPHPLGRLRETTDIFTHSLRTWIKNHDPACYGGQAAGLELQMYNLVRYADSILSQEHRNILLGDPLLRIQQEDKLFKRSWQVGQHLVQSSEHLASVMSLYRRIRQYYGYAAQIEAMEYLKKWLDPAHVPALYPLPRRIDTVAWVEEYAGYLQIRAFDIFSIEQMTLAVLEELHRVLEPYMRRRGLYFRGPQFVGLVSVFIDAWDSEDRGGVDYLARAGLHALQDQFSHLNNFMFLRGP
ncbi:hypothetical protein FB45DRAFT_928505 [Roridomyces roridus]|uniref:DUF6604 domain-containing protein n=1 Tax=Roridomyces roridus TaxID=1738132 RepID=A0AAD7FHY5_9AGAR|nr:hypothetical protein FB45DRAFT_928505 [Roridomyces roridus]